MNLFEQQNGFNPIGGVIWGKNNELYCATTAGGDHNGGTISMVTLNGIVTIFSFSYENGTVPYARPLYDENANCLYGTTTSGGQHNFGTIYSFNLTDKSYTLLYSFDGASGIIPVCSLILENNKLYGCCALTSWFEFGLDYGGNIFSISADGSNFMVLHSFTGLDGLVPISPLTLYNSALYGTTVIGGAHDFGIIFRIGLDGNNFETIHSFTKYNGGHPLGSLVVKNDVIYGVGMIGKHAEFGGCVYSFSITNNFLNILRTFKANIYGAQPYGGLILNGDFAYGICTTSGSRGAGTIYSINVKTNGFKLLRAFHGTGDGSTPSGKMLFNSDKTKLFGTLYSGSFGDNGSIFSYDFKTKLVNIFPFTGVASNLQLSVSAKKNNAEIEIKTNVEPVQTNSKLNLLNKLLPPSIIKSLALKAKK